MNEILKVMLISAVPLIEQRGAIPIGILVDNLNPVTVFVASLAGSLIPAPFVFLLSGKILDIMKKFSFLDWFTKFVDKKIQKGSKDLEKYKEIGLITFIGIPLPTTGIWTGSAIAAFLGLDFKKSMFCAFLGGLISAILITIVTLSFPALLGLKVGH